ncbi:MAG: peptidase associated/transthyretin-like domain-containing protein [Desulfobulbaceae bacterium]
MNTNYLFHAARYKMLFLYFSISLFLMGGCAPAMHDASFKGKVIDEDTKKPIEGAVALAIWTTWMMTPAGEVDDYYDAYETVTDKDGNFSIPGKGPRVATNLNPMQVNVLKAGYSGSSGTIESYSRYSWNKNPQDGRLIIVLKKLTPKQKMMRGAGSASPPDEAPLNKIRNYLIEIDRDSIERGFSPRKEWHGEKYYDKINK